MTWSSFLKKLLRNSAFGIALGLLVFILPLPDDLDPLWEMLQTPIGSLVIVCSIGKALFDTLFFDRYQP